MDIKKHSQVFGELLHKVHHENKPTSAWDMVEAQHPGDVRYNLEGLSILIVDDDPNMRKIIRSVLNTLGVKKIDEAGNGAEALRELRHFAPDIIICDWKMEPINGTEFAKLVRTSPDSPNPFVPIIMLSAHTELEHVIEARDVGIDEFLAKPISAKSLYLHIFSVIEHPRPYIRSEDYFGPSRRRRNNPGAVKKERRTAEDAEDAEDVTS
jgi:CheY-like chemotaxis protein